MYGTYETIDGKPAMRFERRYPHPVERVWRAVTEPEQLAHWFPGGELELEGRVTELEPPRRFSFLWGDEHLHIELEPDGDGCRMRFTHVLSTREQAARDAAGWHVCLDRLDSLLSGDAGEAPGPEVTSEWSEHYEEYQRRGVPAGAEIPGAG